MRHHPLDPPLRQRVLVPARGAVAAASRLPRIMPLRDMCRVTRKHVWDHHISTQELGQRLGLETIDFYISRRQLRWVVGGA